MSKLIAVDFDATLAHYTDWKGPVNTGKPIPEMVERIKKEIAAGNKVEIFTARVNQGHSYEEALNATKSFLAVADWCKKYIGQLLPITAIKSMHVDELWDDKAREVTPNKGVFRFGRKRAG